ncbi:hypothetical protein [Pelomicrobium methylotrophicum]|uniref:Uncharacterized protein n=1 Tax=Pelomicrobium methylotrophicum TaxID=2602750 RepID=A0A5C7EUJ2_9PROT|nr:hypothetical protein [Pelomicrobium methylotrophicum]TXF11912.1 hypothetical protein FR698_07870 [Pelomicrobium methylotrophicum]
MDFRDFLPVIQTTIATAGVIVAALIANRRSSNGSNDDESPPASTKPATNDDPATTSKTTAIATALWIIGIMGFLVMSLFSLPLTAGTVGLAVLSGVMTWTGLWLLLRK